MPRAYGFGSHVSIHQHNLNKASASRALVGVNIRISMNLYGLGGLMMARRFCQESHFNKRLGREETKSISGGTLLYKVELVSLAISHATITGGYSCRSFLGSGTTMIACENLGRKCRGCEIDPGYVAVILQRYKDTFPDKEIKLL